MILVIDVSNFYKQDTMLYQIDSWLGIIVWIDFEDSYPFSNNRPKRAKYCWLNPFVWSCHQEVSVYYTDNYGIILCEIKVCFTSHSSTYRHERFILFFNRVTNNWHILDLVYPNEIFLLDVNYNWCSTIFSTGYFDYMRMILEAKVPSNLEKSSVPPTPQAGSIFSLIMAPIVYATEDKEKIFR